MEAITIYFDRFFGTRLPRALEHAKPPFVVEWQHSRTNRFRQTMPDDEWLAICGQRQWVAFTHDRKFHSIEVETAAITQHNVASFALCGATSTTFDKLRYLVRSFPRMIEIVRSEQPPYLYRIDASARFQRVELSR